jgi:hypothetical protein
VAAIASRAATVISQNLVRSLIRAVTR